MPGVAQSQERRIFRQLPGRRLRWTVAGEQDKNEQGNEDRHQGHTENSVPAEMLSARRGPNSVARAVPLLPAPAMPIAKPWDWGGYQRPASGKATAKLAPATPSSDPDQQELVEVVRP